MADVSEYVEASAEPASPETHVTTQSEGPREPLSRLSAWQAQAIAIGLTALLLLSCAFLVSAVASAR